MRNAPLAPETRVVALDALRGVAIYGVLLVNLVEDFRVSLFSYLQVFHTHPGLANRVVDIAIAVFVEQKAMVVLSFLFGLGLGLQRERLTRPDSRMLSFFVRRYGVLLALGAVHLLFVWTGDILTLYAIAALAIVPLLPLRSGVLAALGVALLIWWASPYPPPSLPFPWPESLGGLAEQCTRVYGAGSVSEVFAFRFHELRSGILPLLVSVLPRTLGLFLIGVAASRHARSPAPPWLGKMAIGCLLAGVFAGAGDVLVAEGRLDLGRFRGCVANTGTLLMGLGYVAMFLVAMERPWFRHMAARLAPIGRMALSNYLAQSFICIAIFYGIGLGAMNRMGSAAAALLATVLFAGQAWVSSVLSRHYRFGPLEWTWRRLTYGSAAQVETEVQPHRE